MGNSRSLDSSSGSESRTAYPEEEKHALKHLLRHLRDRSGCGDRIGVHVLQNCLDIPMLWIRRIIRAFLDVGDDFVNAGPLYRHMSWFVYGSSSYQISILFKALDLKRKKAVDVQDLALMLSHLPKELSVQKMPKDPNKKDEHRHYKIVDVLITGRSDDIMANRKVHRKTAKIARGIIWNYTHSIDGLKEADFTKWINDTPSILLYFLGKIRRFYDVSRRGLISGSASSTSGPGDLSKEEEDLASLLKPRSMGFLCSGCGSKQRRKCYLERLLRGCTKKGKLYNIQGESWNYTLYPAYIKYSCLYLLSPDESKIKQLIYLSSFFASKIPAIPGYSHGFQLVNECGEVASSYTFYYTDEKEIDEWVNAINSCFDYAQLMDSFEQMELIGTGKYSSVYRCVNKTTKAEYAMKSIEKRRLSPSERRLLTNEINISKDLWHKNITKCVDVVETKTHVYIISECVSGGELFSFMKKKVYFNEFEVSYIICLILQALEYLHKRGIVHRDLKPDNILLELDNEKESVVTLKVADFGLSAVLEPGTKLFEACGTPVYVAPEILKRQGYNHQADMWSLGVIAYLLIRGKFPYYSDSNKELFDALVSKEPAFDDSWESVSDDCKDFVKRLLTHDYSQRLTAEQALLHPWIANNSEEIKKKQRNYYSSIPRFLEAVKHSESMASEVDRFEKEFPAEKPIRTCSEADRVIVSLPRVNEESDLKGM